MKDNTKKITAMVLSLIMATGMMTGCGSGSKDASGKNHKTYDATETDKNDNNVI